MVQRPPGKQVDSPRAGACGHSNQSAQTDEALVARSGHGPRSGVQGRAAPRPRRPLPVGATPTRAHGVAQGERSSRGRRLVVTDRQRVPPETGASARLTCLSRAVRIRRSCAWGWAEIASEIPFCASKWKYKFQNVTSGGNVKSTELWNGISAASCKARTWWTRCSGSAREGCYTCGHTREGIRPAARYHWSAWHKTPTVISSTRLPIRGPMAPRVFGSHRWNFWRSWRQASSQPSAVPAVPASTGSLCTLALPHGRPAPSPLCAAPAGSGRPVWQPRGRWCDWGVAPGGAGRATG